jgi:hypothetical protein
VHHVHALHSQVDEAIEHTDAGTLRCASSCRWLTQEVPPEPAFQDARSSSLGSWLSVSSAGADRLVELGQFAAILLGK